MKKAILVVLFIFLFTDFISAQYNPLWIPDTLSGTSFNLTLRDTFTQFFPGQQTITEGVNGKFWGPTLIFHQNDTVHMTVVNSMNDSTTIHWHGFHLPAVMDGGPHQIIPPGTTWQPYWKVTNDASTFWYHPHLHMMAEEQILKGLGGMIIVRDSVESTLALPRNYGVDDVPLALSDRAFITNQISIEPYGDSMMVNGTLRPEFNAPAQVVRFRLLNAGSERSYNVGFSDNRTFYVIGSDGGLLSAPVGVTKYLLSAGERIEILVNFTGQNGTSLFMKAFNSLLTQNLPGGDVFPNGPFHNALARIDFNMLHINVGAQTSNPITTIPVTLRTVTPLNSSSSQLTRTLSITDSIIAGNTGASFVINHRLFNINYIDYQVPLNNIETWQITNSGNFGHPFHIHDVEFNILTRNGVAPPAAEQGWKDVLLIKSQETIRFIAQFKDYSDNIHPFMFHCHITLHEDEGMMGQFVVSGTATGIEDQKQSVSDFSLYPNPASTKLYVAFTDPEMQAYYVRINNLAGKTIMMLPRPQLQNGIDISRLSPGSYLLQLTDEKTKNIVSKQFFKY